MTVGATGATIAADDSTTVEMRILGADPAAEGEARHPAKGFVHYLLGDDRSNWSRNVAGFERVTFSEVLSRIDVAYYGRDRQLEYDFIVKPGADPDVIRIGFEGHRDIRISEGDLVLATSQGELIHNKPLVYQQSSRGRDLIAARYVELADGEIGFDLGDYDTNLPLFIDPIIEFSTFLGGDGAENATDVTVDLQGNVYVTGPLNSTDFPTANPVQGEFSGGLFDCFVSKLSPDGSELIFSTYFGGSSTDDCRGVAVDFEGNVIIVGQTLSGPSGGERLSNGAQGFC